MKVIYRKKHRILEVNYGRQTETKIIAFGR